MFGNKFCIFAEGKLYGEETVIKCNLHCDNACFFRQIDNLGISFYFLFYYIYY